MYFDDLVIIAHKTDMVLANKLVKRKFSEWGIPRQEDKFREENPNGFEGSSRGTILGHEYDLAEGTIGIPRHRLREILEEIRSFESEEGIRKEWESIVGTLSWVRVVIPQIGPMMRGCIRVVKRMETKERRGNMAVKKIIDDWMELSHHLRRWNGKMAIILEKGTKGLEKV